MSEESTRHFYQCSVCGEHVHCVEYTRLVAQECESKWKDRADKLEAGLTNARGWASELAGCVRDHGCEHCVAISVELLDTLDHANKVLEEVNRK